MSIILGSILKDANITTNCIDTNVTTPDHESNASVVYHSICGILILDDLDVIANSNGDEDGGTVDTERIIALHIISRLMDTFINKERATFTSKTNDNGAGGQLRKEEKH
eukprot:1432314-Ditylum_brightwellii.AAC.1